MAEYNFKWTCGRENNLNVMKLSFIKWAQLITGKNIEICTGLGRLGTGLQLTDNLHTCPPPDSPAPSISLAAVHELFLHLNASMSFQSNEY